MPHLDIANSHILSVWFFELIEYLNILSGLLYTVLSLLAYSKDNIHKCSGCPGIYVIIPGSNLIRSSIIRSSSIIEKSIYAILNRH